MQNLHFLMAVFFITTEQKMPINHIHKKIDEWFLGFKTRATKARPVESFSPITKTPPLKLGTGLTNLKAAAQKSPEVVIKIPKRLSKHSKGLKGIRNHLDYISRNGKINVETQDGEKLNNKTEIHNLIKDWSKLGIPEESRYREALNIVLSMPPGTPPQAVLNAARNFAAEQFIGHQYTFVLHHHSEKEGETAHPHVHLCVLMRDELGKRINPRKNDLFEWRVRFAEKLREQGVRCSATRRQHRGRVQKQGWEKSTAGRIEYRHQQGKSQKRSFIAKQEILELASALSKNKKPNNPYLKNILQTRGIITEEYGMIAKQLYQHGYKTEAKLISKLQKEVLNNPIDTQLQQKFDQLNYPTLSHSPSNHIEPEH